MSDYIYHFSFVFWNNYSSPPVTALEGFTADEANAFVNFLALQEVHPVVILLLEPRLPAPEVECKAMYRLMWCLYHVNKFGVVIHCWVFVIRPLNRPVLNEYYMKFRKGNTIVRCMWRSAWKHPRGVPSSCCYDVSSSDVGTNIKNTNKQWKFLFPMAPNTGVCAFIFGGLSNEEWWQNHLEIENVMM